MNPIKICFVTREYAHVNLGKTGGIGVFLKQFTKQLKHRDFDIVVFTYGKDSIRFIDDGVRVVKIRDLRGINEWIKRPWRRYNLPGYITLKLLLEFFNRVYISMYLSLFVLKNRFDLIEFHDYGGDAPYFLGRMVKVIRCHGSALTLHQFMGYVKRLSDSVFEKQLFSRFNKHVLAVSNYSARITQQGFGLKNKPKVIYNGVVLPLIKNKHLYLDNPTIPLSVFYFGSIRERKGMAIACEVFNMVVERFSNATFHVLGNNNNDYWNKEALKILSPNAIEQTKYYGTVQNTDISQYLEKAHVVIFPSYGENFSIAVLEVMALGKIVLTSNIPSFNEIIVHAQNGLIADSKEAYFECIIQLFEGNYDTEFISKQALNTIKERFESEFIIDQNIKYYKNLL